MLVLMLFCPGLIALCVGGGVYFYRRGREHARDELDQTLAVAAKHHAEVCRLRKIICDVDDACELMDDPGRPE